MNRDAVSTQESTIQVHYDGFAQAYNKTRSLQHGMLLETWRLLSRFFPELNFQRVLDLGCGTGSLLGVLGQGLQSYCGVDISPKMLELAAGEAANIPFNVSFVCGDIECLPLPSHSFDLVFSNSVIHWLNAPGLNKVTNAMREVHRVLDSGGVFVGSVSGTGTASRILEVYRSVITEEGVAAEPFSVSYDPIRSMSVDSVVRELRSTGFKITSATNVYQPVIFPSVVDYLDIVQAYGYEMFMEPVRKMDRERVWLDVKGAVRRALPPGQYIHDQYVVYFLAEKA